LFATSGLLLITISFLILAILPIISITRSLHLLC
jgi:hypothetical protein